MNLIIMKSMFNLIIIKDMFKLNIVQMTQMI